ncbi:MAG: type II toxin-antitoxin system VapC family toxin [Polyangia bacterium]|jgi:PIN domain nuclease of toxin-antitoxin system|nr:type II toxin-antitoxin system VapC family toxin [Polyangia bacterium]
MIPMLDTHILLWWVSGGGHLSRKQQAVLGAATDKTPLHLADITLWEIAMLVNLGRIKLQLPLRDWLARATAPPMVIRHGISPEIAAEVAALPESFHRDPADRIIVATARVLGATLLTQDKRIVSARIVPTQT